MRGSLSELRDEQGVDQTLQNLLRALTLNLELRARYRVFEFEAAQDGLPRPPSSSASCARSSPSRSPP